MREYSLALRLASELADLRAANAYRILPPAATERGSMKECGTSKKKSTANAVLLFLARVDKKDAIQFYLLALKISKFSQTNESFPSS